MDPAGVVSDGNHPNDEESVSPPPAPGGPGNSQPRRPAARKRTKTGCLSKSYDASLQSLSPLFTYALTPQSVPEAPYQVRRGQAYLQQLHQVEATMRGIQPKADLQGTARVLSPRHPLFPCLLSSSSAGCARQCPARGVARSESCCGPRTTHHDCAETSFSGLYWKSSHAIWTTVPRTVNGPFGQTPRHEPDHV